MVDAENKVGRSRNEYTELIDCVVGGVKVSVVFEWVAGTRSREEQGGRNTLVYCILGNVNKEERKHVREEELAGTEEINADCRPEAGFGKVRWVGMKGTGRYVFFVLRLAE